MVNGWAGRPFYRRGPVRTTDDASMRQATHGVLSVFGSCSYHSPIRPEPIAPSPMTPGTYRFARFELDPSGRTLRLEGREILIQPRVFDLLRYLVEHRDRVVSKDELLDALWPGVVVTESSLQRAVSIARGALEQGGMAGAIRNYARRGYRFMPDKPPSARIADARPALSLLDAAEHHYGEARWQDAMDAFAAADLAGPLDADPLERWGIAAQCLGNLAGAVAPLERAAVVFSSRGEREAAARVILSLARIQLESLDLAVAQGCLRRADRLLNGLPPSAPHGHLAWMSARMHLNTGDLPEAVRLAQQARDLGRQLGSPDIESMGLLMMGIALQASGDAKTGLAMQDEAAAAVLSEDVSPLVGGILYCGIISSCCNAGDWQRASQWTDSFTRWCRRSNIDTFAGACLVHQAEFFAMCGRLDDARDTIQRADAPIRVGAPWALAMASRVLGEVHLARGELDDAERCFQDTYQRGGDPYPGYAELLQHRGRVDEALRGLKRAASLTHWMAGQRRTRYLAQAAQIAAVSHRFEEAHALLRVLDEDSGIKDLGALVGQVDCARAELAWAESRSDDAVNLLYRAVECMQRNGAVMEAARIHLRLAQLLAQQEEVDASLMELRVAEAMFERARATWYLDDCRKVRGQLTARSPK